MKMSDLKRWAISGATSSRTLVKEASFGHRVFNICCTFWLVPTTEIYYHSTGLITGEIMTLYVRYWYESLVGVSQSSGALLLVVDLRSRQ